MRALCSLVSGTEGDVVAVGLLRGEERLSVDLEARDLLVVGLEDGGRRGAIQTASGMPAK